MNELGMTRLGERFLQDCKMMRRETERERQTERNRTIVLLYVYTQPLLPQPHACMQLLKGYLQNQRPRREKQKEMKPESYPKRNPALNAISLNPEKYPIHTTWHVMVPLHISLPFY